MANLNHRIAPAPNDQTLTTADACTGRWHNRSIAMQQCPLRFLTLIPIRLTVSNASMYCRIWAHNKIFETIYHFARANRYAKDKSHIQSVFYLILNKWDRLAIVFRQRTPLRRSRQNNFMTKEGNFWCKTIEVKTSLIIITKHNNSWFKFGI